MENHDSYEKQVEAQLKQWDVRIEAMKAKAEQVKEENRRELKNQLDELIKLQKETWNEMERLKQASDDAWEDVKKGVESSYTSLKNSIETATSRFM